MFNAKYNARYDLSYKSSCNNLTVSLNSSVLKKDLKNFFASSPLRSWHLSKSDYDEIMLLFKKNKK